MLFAAAAPIVISVAAVVFAPPENALIELLPDTPPALNVAVATPFTVLASTGSTEPSVGANVTIVPFWTGVPLDSITTARRIAWPLSGNTLRSVVKEIVDPVGEVSGTFEQAAAAAQTATIVTNAKKAFRVISAVIQF
jgi:hypothetical protein